MPFDQKQYTADYDKKFTTRVYIKLNKKTDDDIIRKLGSIPNKQGYIKGLIRRDMQSGHDEK